jgi:hypothetical protein
VAAVFGLFGPNPRLVGLQAFEDAGRRAVYLSQCVALAASAACVVLWLAGHLRREVAITAGLVFGTNPYSVVLTGLLHYDVVHILLLIVSCWLLTRALGSGGGFLWAGLSAGIATLVRSVTLPLPALLPLVLWIRFRKDTGRILPAFLLFLVGFLAPVLPWTARNYVVTRALVPVTQNAWQNLWAQTEKPLNFDPNYYNFFDVSAEYGENLKIITGREGFDYPTFVRLNTTIEARFKDLALVNLRRQPGTYIRNCLGSLRTLALDINSVFLRVFVYLQGTPRDTEISQGFFLRGAPDVFGSYALAHTFEVFVGALTLLAALGVLFAVTRKTSWVLATGITCLAVALTHTLVFMSLMYYYVKLPFLVVFASYGVDALHGIGWRGALARLVEALLLAASTGLSAWVLFLS